MISGDSKYMNGPACQGQASIHEHSHYNKNKLDTHHTCLVTIEIGRCGRGTCMSANETTLHPSHNYKNEIVRVAQNLNLQYIDRKKRIIEENNINRFVL
ncbi:hypothetical protein AM593_05079, partial [Mytilus galloprovincialis]